MNNLEIKKLYEILCSEDVVSSINDNIDYLLMTIPEIKNMIGFNQKNPHHHLDVWNHTLLALSMSKNDFDIRLTLLLHDIGKPFCYEEKDGVRHFNGHPHKSALISYDILKRLNLKEEYINKICSYIEMHDTPITKQMIEKDYNFVIKLYEVQKCDSMAHHPDKLEIRKSYLEKVKKKILDIK